MLHKPIYTTVYGKILLFGEHLVFEGANAIGMPISKKAKSSFVKNDNKKFILQSFIKTKSDTLCVDIPPAFFTHLQKTCEYFKIAVPNKTLFGTLTINAFFPIGSGLGSSAVFCSIIAKTIYLYSFPQQNQHSLSSLTTIWHIAHNLELFFHSKTSGIDTGICVYNKPLFFLNNGKKIIQSKKISVPQVTPLAFKWNFPCKIVCGCIGRTQSCTHTILQVSKKISSDVDIKNKWLLYNQKATEILINHYNKPVPKNNYKNIVLQVTHAANSIHTLFTQLGISTPLLDDIITYAISCGASGGKMSGGGAGGAFVLFCKNKKTATTVYNKINQKFNTQALMIL